MNSYRDAGVDLTKADTFVESIGDSVTATWGRNVVGGFGGFAAGVTLPDGYTDPVLMMSTDGVGTKLEIARRVGRYEGVGHDLVAMCVDDLAAVGARAIAFTDYLAVGRLDPVRDRKIVSSIAEACSAAGCALVGGETAEHPGVVDQDHVDLAGAALGVVENGSQISGSALRVGDVIIGIGSPNVRSNGFSLIRAILEDRDLESPFPGKDLSIGEVLLSPSVIYTPAVLAAAGAASIGALVHVTGGGIAGNLSRVLPEGLHAVVESGTWPTPKVFRVVQEWGTIPEEEMLRVFNMGLGYLAVVPPGEADVVETIFNEHDHGTHRVGRIVEGERGVTILPRR